MQVLCGVFVLSLCVYLCACNIPVYAGGKPLGILAMAYGAHLNGSNAFAGLSVFDRERLSTEGAGKISVRIGASVITLARAKRRNAATHRRWGARGSGC